MPVPPVRARAPRRSDPPQPLRDPEILQAYVEDASAYPGGEARGLLRTAEPEAAAAWLRATWGSGVSALPQAARSSLTGGAVPRGEVVLSVEKWTEIGAVSRHAGGARLDVGAGVRLRDLQRALGEVGWYYPPVPTHQEAMIGGTAATNAGGAASFKYGVTRDWVHGLTVLLDNGDVLEIERGEAIARVGETFRIVMSDATEREVPAPDHRLPALKKISAGYFAAPALDLVDLFIGSEGTLGVIASVRVDVVPRPPSVATGIVFFVEADRLLAVGGAMRQAALAARQRRDPRGPDVRAIESLDAHCLDLLRLHGEGKRLRIDIPSDARAALLFELELPERTSRNEAESILEAYLNGGPKLDSPLARLFRILDAEGVLDRLEFAFPDDEARQTALVEFREAAPLRVNEILAERRRVDPSVRKMGGDLIVPFERLGEMLAIYEDGFGRRGLEFAVWGHVSDGNLHPNALARNAREMDLAQDALREFADAASARGGAPLSEHGVGRSPLKQELLRRFLGDAAIARMRAVKRALDPAWRFAPGVLFEEVERKASSV